MNKLVLPLFSFAILLSGPAFTQPKGHDMRMKTMTPEDRKSMAAQHEKMATCLRSNKPMSECKKEMKSMMGDMSCPMMDNNENGEENERK